MKFLGCPILGDSIYSKTDKNFPNATLMLHSVQLKIKLPQAQNINQNSSMQSGNYKNSIEDGLTLFRTKTPDRFIEIEKKLKKMFPKTFID